MVPDYKEKDGIIYLEDGSCLDSNEINKAEEDDSVCYRIRKLTPLECWRLMGFSDEDFLSAKLGSREKAKEYIREYEPDRHFEMMQSVELKGVSQISRTQMYKQAGNSVTTCTLYYIFKNLYKAMPYLFDDLTIGSFFSGIGAYEKALGILQNDLKNGVKPYFANGEV